MKELKEILFGVNIDSVYGDTNLINSEIDIYRSITREEIRDVANKYLNSNQRLELDYLPGDEQNKTVIEWKKKS